MCVHVCWQMAAGSKCQVAHPPFARVHCLSVCPYGWHIYVRILACHRFPFTLDGCKWQLAKCNLSQFGAAKKDAIKVADLPQQQQQQQQQQQATLAYEQTAFSKVRLWKVAHKQTLWTLSDSLHIP